MCLCGFSSEIYQPREFLLTPPKTTNVPPQISLKGHALKHPLTCIKMAVQNTFTRSQTYYPHPDTTTPTSSHPHPTLTNAHVEQVAGEQVFVSDHNSVP